MTDDGPRMKKDEPVKTLIAIEFLEMTNNGLKRIVRMECEDNITDEKIIHTMINDFTEMVYKNDKMFFVTETQGFAIKGMQNKTIVVKGIFKYPEL